MFVNPRDLFPLIIRSFHFLFSLINAVISCLGTRFLAARGSGFSPPFLVLKSFTMKIFHGSGVDSLYQV